MEDMSWLYPCPSAQRFPERLKAERNKEAPSRGSVSCLGRGGFTAYHSVDDDVSEQFLREQLFENPERVLLLYSILKDADALDRARFGLQAVDPDYFRIKQSIQILPTAQMAIGHLLL